MPEMSLENNLPPKSPSSTERFFNEMSAMDEFDHVTDMDRFHSAPLDWHVVITDVVNSTGAIESGNYRSVNILGATTIIAVLNIAGDVELPFVFGGDGASFLIPPSLLPDTRLVLAATKVNAREAFGLELRVGIVPVRKVASDGYVINIAKLKISDHFAEAVFEGGGLSYAEKLIKRPPAGEVYELTWDGEAPEANLEGLECRWNPIPSAKGEIVSMLIQARGENNAEKLRTYQEVIRKIESIFGKRQDYHPIAQEKMELSRRPKHLLMELRMKWKFRFKIQEWLQLGWMLLEGLVGNIIFKKRAHFKGVDWGAYKDTLIQNTDYQKFDDMIRMVISCSTVQRKTFESYLEEQWKLGRLVYGLHISSEALLTCLVFDRQNRHFHFVDGSDGGYALAAKTMKRQLKELAERKANY